jgi:hypothetical protein
MIVFFPNHNTTTYYVYWRTTTTINPIIKRPHCMFTDRRQQRQPNHNSCCLPSVNTICGRIMIGLSLSSVSKHNMWSCYNWVVVLVFHLLTQYVVVLWLGCRCCRPSVNTISGRIIIGLSLLSSVSKHNMWSYYDWVPHIVFTDGRQRQPNHNTTTYCVYWRKTTTTTQS